MERSVAARSPVGTLDILWRPFEAAAGLARGSSRTIARHRRLRIALLVALVAVPLLAGGWLLARRSSFTAVERVQVSGVHGPQARAIEAALEEAAGHMSTLDVRRAALQAAVASYPVVRAVHAVPSFPHGLRIVVLEQLPVAALQIGGQRTAIAADGVVLGPGLITGSLPALSEPQGLAPVVGGRVQGQTLLAELAILGAEPGSLMRFDARVYSGSQGEGLTVAMRNGLLVYFGDATRPHAKWLSLARVLADPSSVGARYIDVRVPERPAAGFAFASALAEASSSTTAAGMAGSSETSSSTAATGSTPEATIAQLATKLTETTNGGSAAATATATAGGADSTTADPSESSGASSETEASSTATAGASAVESTSGSGESRSPGESESSAGTASTGG